MWQAGGNIDSSGVACAEVTRDIQQYLALICTCAAEIKRQKQNRRESLMVSVEERRQRVQDATQRAHASRQRAQALLDKLDVAARASDDEQRRETHQSLSEGLRRASQDFDAAMQDLDDDVVAIRDGQLENGGVAVFAVGVHAHASGAAPPAIRNTASRGAAGSASSSRSWSWRAWLSGGGDASAPEQAEQQQQQQQQQQRWLVEVGGVPSSPQAAAFTRMSRDTKSRSCSGSTFTHTSGVPVPSAAVTLPVTYAAFDAPSKSMKSASLSFRT